MNQTKKRSLVSPTGYDGEAFDSGSVRYVAHRGFSGAAPENTLPAYELAGAAGFWGGEFDTTVTSDGKWVVIHDETVDRTTNGSGRVSDMTFERIRALSVTGGNNVERYPHLQVPTLSEVLATCKQVGIVPVIEIKSGSYTEEQYLTLIEDVQKLGLETKCIVISFSYEVLENIRRLNPYLPIQFLADITDDNIERIKRLGNAGFDSNRTRLTKPLIEQAHRAGLIVNTWTVNNATEAQQLINAGVDYISTDHLIGGVTHD
ncbi:glycerophosphodiester phosphodiesterase [Shouchella patagoniensis]|uniref:glycerophosphodiester phosphodiesterase n=1 Tax=Shouchella patagoniensis TaxID=228576 RepID=UPI001474AC35|nr:glycerophosphodiester phosphodiesterase [Shouchella patagoniensis]